MKGTILTLASPQVSQRHRRRSVRLGQAPREFDSPELAAVADAGAGRGMTAVERADADRHDKIERRLAGSHHEILGRHRSE